eukprot:Tbor_TRINITY_DN6211_c0_g3::TRINITY_DN6211_c0_g3_i1::g.2176::m.2176
MSFLDRFIYDYCTDHHTLKRSVTNRYPTYDRSWRTKHSGPWNANVKNTCSLRDPLLVLLETNLKKRGFDKDYNSAASKLDRERDEQVKVLRQKIKKEENDMKIRGIKRENKRELVEVEQQELSARRRVFRAYLQELRSLGNQVAPCTFSQLISDEYKKRAELVKTGLQDLDSLKSKEILIRNGLISRISSVNATNRQFNKSNRKIQKVRIEIAEDVPLGSISALHPISNDKDTSSRQESSTRNEATLEYNQVIFSLNNEQDLISPSQEGNFSYIDQGNDETEDLLLETVNMAERDLYCDDTSTPDTVGKCLLSVQESCIGLPPLAPLNESNVSDSTTDTLSESTTHLSTFKPFLGISLVEVSQENVSLGLVVDAMYIGGPGDKAGIELGDVLFAVGGVRIYTFDDIREVMKERAVIGEYLTLTLFRPLTEIQIESGMLPRQFDADILLVTTDESMVGNPFYFDIETSRRISREDVEIIPETRTGSPDSGSPLE